MPSTLQSPSGAVRQPAKLRRAIPADVDELASVLHASRLASQPAIPPPVHAEAEMRDWFEQVVLPINEVWLAVCAPADVDVVTALMVLADEWIDQLYVRPGWTGLGLGKMLLDHAKLSRQSLQLWTFQSNTGARRFYEREGFVAVEETNGSGNEERSPDVRYEWRGVRSADRGPGQSRPG